MNQREPQPPQPGKDETPRPDVPRRPADEEQPQSHPDLERDRPPVSEVDRDPSEGISAGIREEYDEAQQS